jgi:hypothetical protein
MEQPIRARPRGQPALRPEIRHRYGILKISERLAATRRTTSGRIEQLVVGVIPSAPLPIVIGDTWV